MNSIRLGAWVMTFFILARVASAQYYTVTDLGTLPGGTYSKAVFINDQDEVVGNADTATGAVHAFLWTAAKGMQDLGTLPGDTNSLAYAVNNLGVVVGESNGSISHAFLWIKKSGMRDLGTLGGSKGAYATGIDRLGEVIGYSYIAGNSANHAFLWTPTDGMQDLGTLGGDDSYALGISPTSGQVVGYSLLPGNPPPYRAFLWSKKSGMQNLGALNDGDRYSVANSVNDKGWVVGYSGSGGFDTAFSWNQGQGMGTLYAGNESIAYAISPAPSNYVVGSFWVSGDGPFALCWTSNFGVRNLNDLIPQGSGWVLTQAVSVNLANEVVANGAINGAYHAALLSPVFINCGLSHGE